MSDKAARPARRPLVAGLRHRRLQRRRRQRVPRLHRSRHARCSRPRRHRRQPELSANTTVRWPSQIAERFGLQHEIIQTSELERPEYRANPANRCYYCKHELYTHLSRIAAERGATWWTATMPTIAATTGRADRRRENSASAVRSTRWISAKTKFASCRGSAGLPTWDEPASACLSSRIPYHSEVTDEKLRMIERCRAGAARARLSRVPRPPSRRAGADRARTRRAGSRLEPEVGRQHRARTEGGSVTATSPSICRATAPAVSTRDCLLRPA